MNQNDLYFQRARWLFFNLNLKKMCKVYFNVVDLPKPPCVLVSLPSRGSILFKSFLEPIHSQSNTLKGHVVEAVHAVNRTGSHIFTNDKDKVVRTIPMCKAILSAQ